MPYRCPSQVLPLLSLLVPSGQIVLDQIEFARPPRVVAPCKFALVKLACDPVDPSKVRLCRSAPVKLVCARVESIKFNTPVVEVKLVLVKLEFVKVIISKKTLERLAPLKLELEILV